MDIVTSEEDARIRIRKTITFQKEHDTYLVYEKSSGRAIGFAGVEEIEPYIYQETGICLGPDYVGKGFGKQILQGLIQYCKDGCCYNLLQYSYKMNTAHKGEL